MNKKTQALLVDVVQLVSKHGIDTFDLLAREIRKDEFVNNLAQILERIATESAALVVERNRGKSVNRAPAKRRNLGIQKVLKDISDQDPEKGRLLSGFRDDLLAGVCLPRLRDIEDFVEDSGLHPLKATSRSTAINSLLRCLSELPRVQLEALIEDARRVVQPIDRSLARWSDVILEGRGRLHSERSESQNTNRSTT